MNRSIIFPLGLLTIFAAMATGCAAETMPETEWVEEHSLTEGVRMVGIDGQGSERASIPNRVSSTGAEDTGAGPMVPEGMCLGCGPVPDPWKNGPVPDPWAHDSRSTPETKPPAPGGGSSDKGSHNGHN